MGATFLVLLFGVPAIVLVFCILYQVYKIIPFGSVLFLVTAMLPPCLFLKYWFCENADAFWVEHVIAVVMAFGIYLAIMGFPIAVTFGSLWAREGELHQKHVNKRFADTAGKI